MDLLSVATSVVGLLSFCVDVGSYLAEMKNAPKSAERLHAQVLSLQGDLRQLDTFLRGESFKDKSFAETSALVQSTEVCECHLVQVLEKLKNVNKNFLHRATFPLNERKSTNLLSFYEAVHRISSSL